MYKILITLFHFFLLSHPAISSETDLSDMQISLLTCDPGKELYSAFGHTALRVNIPIQGIDLVYNYGTFDFRTEGFYIKFLRGALPYRLAVEDISQFLNEYNYLERGVREQVLRLNDEEKRNIWLFLQENMRPENIEYPYDFFFDNCSTRVRDLIINNLRAGKASIEQLSEKGEYTFRQLLHQYLRSRPWTRLGIDLIIGKRADRIASLRDQMFLPDYLHDNLVLLSNESNEPWVMESYKLLSFQGMRHKTMNPTINWPVIVFISMSISLLVLKYFCNKILATKILNSFAFLVGIAGCLVLFMTVGTVHYATKFNFNLMFLHPGFLFIPFLRGKSKYNLLIICIILTALFTVLALFGLANSIVSTWPVLLFVFSALLAIWHDKPQEDRPYIS